MTKHSDIWQELKAVAPGLADLAQPQPLPVPEGYFDLFPEVVLRRIKGEETLVLGAGKPEQQVPAGYFEGLADRIMGRVNAAQPETPTQEIADIAPTLSGLSRQMPHQVPDGYFDRLPETLTEHHQTKAPVVQMRFTRVIRLAAAAVVAGLLFTGAWFLFQERKTNPYHGDMAKVDNHTDSSTLTENAMAAYLDQTKALDELDPAMPESAKPEDVALLNLDDQKLGEILSTMSDKDISEYEKSDPNSSPNVMEN